MKEVTQSQFCDILCKDYNIDQQYKSISEAGELTKTNRTSISLCINNKQQKANNFIWKKKQI